MFGLLLLLIVASARQDIFEIESEWRFWLQWSGRSVRPAGEHSRGARSWLPYLHSSSSYWIWLWGKGEPYNMKLWKKTIFGKSHLNFMMSDRSSILHKSSGDCPRFAFSLGITTVCRQMVITRIPSLGASLFTIVPSAPASLGQSSEQICLIQLSLFVC